MTLSGWIRPLARDRWVVVAVLVSCACSDPDTPERSQVDFDAPAPVPDAAIEAAASAPPPVVSPPAAVPSTPGPAPKRRCEPGTYTGRFMCSVSALFPWNGEMAFSLVEEEEALGEEFTRLRIVPGTTIEGADEQGGVFETLLTGMLDCETGRLEGLMEDGTYMNAFMTISMIGELSGQFEDEEGPAFVGEMGPLTSPDLGLLGPTAECEWSAELAE